MRVVASNLVGEGISRSQYSFDDIRLLVSERKFCPNSMDILHDPPPGSDTRKVFISFHHKLLFLNTIVKQIVKMSSRICSFLFRFFDCFNCINFLSTSLKAQQVTTTCCWWWSWRCFRCRILVNVTKVNTCGMFEI